MIEAICYFPITGWRDLYFTDVYKARQYTNIDDWECTLMLAQLGLKYQDYDLKQQMKEFEEQLRSQTKE